MNKKKHVLVRKKIMDRIHRHWQVGVESVRQTSLCRLFSVHDLLPYHVPPCRLFGAIEYSFGRPPNKIGEKNLSRGLYRYSCTVNGLKAIRIGWWIWLISCKMFYLPIWFKCFVLPKKKERKTYTAHVVESTPTDMFSQLGFPQREREREVLVVRLREESFTLHDWKRRFIFHKIHLFS